jgi:hypothetical protein
MAENDWNGQGYPLKVDVSKNGSGTPLELKVFDNAKDCVNLRIGSRV